MSHSDLRKRLTQLLNVILSYRLSGLCDSKAHGRLMLRVFRRQSLHAHSYITTPTSDPTPVLIINRIVYKQSHAQTNMDASH